MLLNLRRNSLACLKLLQVRTTTVFEEVWEKNFKKGKEKKERRKERQRKEERQ